MLTNILNKKNVEVVLTSSKVIEEFKKLDLPSFPQQLRV